MAPIPDDPATMGQMPDPETIGSVQADPIRILVQAALALYLMPLVLVVCLIGGASILVSGAARIASKFILGKDRQLDPVRPARTEAGEIGTRRAADRKRSHITR